MPETFWVNLAREIARGVIEGLCIRYSVQDLQWHVDHDTDLITSASTIGTARDRKELARLYKLAQRFHGQVEKARSAVTADWVVSRIEKYFPPYGVILNTYQGRRWVEKNINAGFRYFLGS